MNIAKGSSWKSWCPSWAWPMLEAIESEHAGCWPRAAWDQLWRISIWRTRRCQSDLGVGSQEVATQMRQQPVLEDERL